VESKLLWPIVGFVGYAIVINAVAYGMFALDKTAAMRGEWRISERALLLVALVGGSVGAITAQQRLRHKTRKEPFRSVLYGTVLFQIAGLTYLYLNRAAVSKLVNAIATL
jgi:uncharacterized membrane protein YsdA (DUF1294 family)